jgi:hypothetical protein
MRTRRGEKIVLAATIITLVISVIFVTIVFLEPTIPTCFGSCGCHLCSSPLPTTHPTVSAASMGGR